jgi:hypothetical protein
MTAVRRVGWAAALAGAVVVGYLVVAAFTGAGSRRTAPSTPRRGAKHAVGNSQSARPTTSITTSDHTPQVAVASAAAYLRFLDSASDTAATITGLREVTGPGFSGQALEAESQRAALVREIAQSGASFVRGWRLGYRLDSYGPGSARVSVWSMGMAQSRLEVIAPDFSTTVCRLRWDGRRWRVVGARVVQGPTPPLDGSDPAAVSTFVRVASSFQSFPDAP